MDCRGFGEISFERHQYQEQATFASFAARHLQAQRVMLRSQSPFLRVNPFPSAKTQQPTKNFYSALGRCWPTCSEVNYAPHADGCGDLTLNDRYAYRFHNKFCWHAPRPTVGQQIAFNEFARRRRLNLQTPTRPQFKLDLRSVAQGEVMQPGNGQKTSQPRGRTESDEARGRANQPGEVRRE